MIEEALNLAYHGARAMEGTGLGLSISYGIVTQEHGSTITVDSQISQFTEFTVRHRLDGMRPPSLATIWQIT